MAVPLKPVLCNVCQNQITQPGNALVKPWSAIAILQAPLFYVINVVKSVAGVKKSTATCDACLKKGSVMAPDEPKLFQQITEKLQANSQRIQDLESRLGKGGDKIVLTTGDVLYHCGTTMNKIPGAVIVPKAGTATGGAESPGESGPGSSGHPRGNNVSVTQGLNPVATPGGQFKIFCTNKFVVKTGALGMDFNTFGKLSMHAGGGIHISGPELTLGSSTRLVLEGEAININAKSIKLTPSTDGGVSIGGSLLVPSNLIVGGQMHAENLSMVNAHCVAKNTLTTSGAPTDNVTGPAKWYSTQYWPNNTIVVVTDLLTTILEYITEPRKILNLLTRGAFKLNDKIQNIAYSILPQEIKPTGICILTSTTQGFIFNYPHNHSVHDGEHSHASRVPNINLYDTDDGVRAAAAGTGGNAPLGGTMLQTILADQNIISKAIGSVWALFLVIKKLLFQFF